MSSSLPPYRIDREKEKGNMPKSIDISPSSTYFIL